MSDVAAAKNIIDEVYDIKQTGRARVIAAAFEALKRIERTIDKAILNNRPRQWTERRVRSIVDEEATRIDHYEITDLQRLKIEEARHELEKSKARAARLAALLRGTTSVDCAEDDRPGELARGVSCTGDQGRNPTSKDEGR